MEPWTQAGLAAFGFCVGLVGTVLGVGGGFFMVPFLMVGMGFTPQKASATSLAVIFICGVSGSISYLVQKRVLLHPALLLSAAVIPGAFIGTHINQYINKVYFEIFFTLFLLVMVGFLARRKTGTAQDGTVSPERISADAIPWKLAVPVTFVIGIGTTILGIGGGIIFTPTLAFLFGLPVVIAVATSYFVLTLNSFAATLSSLNLGQVHLTVVLLMGAGGGVGAQVGARLASRVRPDLVKNLLWLVLLILTAGLVIDTVLTGFSSKS